MSSPAAVEAQAASQDRRNILLEGGSHTYGGREITNHAVFVPEGDSLQSVLLQILGGNLNLVEEKVTLTERLGQVETDTPIFEFHDQTNGYLLRVKVTRDTAEAQAFMPALGDVYTHLRVLND